MEIDELLKKGEEAFNNMAWEEVAKINEEILDQKPDGRVKELATGFYHYALAKLGKEPMQIISDLEKASQSFKSADEDLASFAEIEKLILLSEFDEANKGQHLRALGEFTQGLFTRTGEASYLQLAIEALENARFYFEGKEQAQINLNLTFCYGNYALYSEAPKKTFEEMVRLCEELEKSFEGNKIQLARVKMNHALACQNLASLDDKDSKQYLEEAERLTEEAMMIFKKMDSHPELVKAKQTLANILRDSAFHDPDNAVHSLKRVIEIREEISKRFLDLGADIDHAYETLDSGVAYLELAPHDKANSEDHLKEAVKRFKMAAEVFERERQIEDLGLAKQGIAATYKMKFSINKDISLIKKAIEMYQEAIDILEKEKNPALLARVKTNLATAYRDVSSLDQENREGYLKKADILDKEAEELLQEGRVA